ncbi:MAG: cyclase family protein [Oscillospiraceae bacterium]|nr:cyclase family protein [Oscillospiraceae bacterium]
MIKGRRLVDLSHVLIPGEEEYHLRLTTHNTDDLYPQYRRDEGVWYILQDIEMSSHCGTHIEFPYHHSKDGLDAASFPLSRLMGDCALLDLRHRGPNEAVGVDDLLGSGERVREGDMVMLWFDRSHLYRTGRSHERPYLSMEAARWLVEGRGVTLIGSDASGIEIKGAPNQPIHQYLMDRGIPIIEFAANLGQLSRGRFTLLVPALAVRGLDSCPIRLLALEDE